MRTPAPDHGPCHASWCLELTWWVRPSLPAFCSPAVGGMGGPLVLGGAPAGCPLCLLHSHLGLGGLCFLLCLSWPPHFREGPLLGTLVTRGPTLLTPLPSAHSTLARPPSLAGPGCLPGHRTRPVNLTASGAVAGGGCSLKEPSEGALQPWASPLLQGEKGPPGASTAAGGLAECGEAAAPTCPEEAAASVSGRKEGGGSPSMGGAGAGQGYGAWTGTGPSSPSERGVVPRALLRAGAPMPGTCLASFREGWWVCSPSQSPSEGSREGLWLREVTLRAKAGREAQGEKGCSPKLGARLPQALAPST